MHKFPSSQEAGQTENDPSSANFTAPPIRVRSRLRGMLLPVPPITLNVRVATGPDPLMVLVPKSWICKRPGAAWFQLRVSGLVRVVFATLVTVAIAWLYRSLRSIPFEVEKLVAEMLRGMVAEGCVWMSSSIDNVTSLVPTTMSLTICVVLAMPPLLRAAESQVRRAELPADPMTRNATHATSSVPASGVEPVRWISTVPGIVRL